MAYKTVRERYVSDGAGVVPQPRLLIMLYDRLVVDLEQADAALTTEQFYVVNEKLCNAQSIILELQSALDVDAWDGAVQLNHLYTWFNEELVAANLTKSAKPIRDCLKMIRELNAAWHSAYDQVLAEQAALVTGGDTKVGAEEPGSEAVTAS